MTAEQIKALNKMIAACIKHGGDWGGPYFSHLIECEDAIANFLNTQQGLYDIKIDDSGWLTVVEV